MNNNTSASRTFTFESLSYESPQHLATVVAEGRRSVRVDKQTVWTDLEVLHRGRRCRETKMSGRDTEQMCYENICWIYKNAQIIKKLSDECYTKYIKLLLIQQLTKLSIFQRESGVFLQEVTYVGDCSVILSEK